MTKRFLSFVLGIAGGAVLLFALYRDYLHSVSTGRPLGWFALEAVLLAAVVVSFVLISQRQRELDLAAITGLRALAAIAVILTLLVPAFAAGMYLDTFFGPHVSFAVLFVVLMAPVARRIFGILSSRSPLGAAFASSSGDATDVRPASPPPN